MLDVQNAAPEKALQGNCVICNGTLRPQPAIRLPGFQLMACENCRSWTSWPRPSASEQAALHDDEAYFQHPYVVHRRAHTRAVEQRCAATFKRIGAVVGLPPLNAERILDVGCDTGEFVAAAARRFGSVPVGFDVAGRAVEGARAAGVEAYQTTLEEAPPLLRDFPVITAIDVIEHVAQPAAFLQSLRDRLRPGGVAYVETPNLDSAIYRFGRVLCTVTRGRPEAVFRRLFPLEHVQYYSPEGIECLARSCGLELQLLKSRVLPSGEIAVGWITRIGLFMLQCFDRITGHKALIWAILRRPRADAA